jgi:hypothetical protein
MKRDRARSNFIEQLVIASKSLMNYIAFDYDRSKNGQMSVTAQELKRGVRKFGNLTEFVFPVVIAACDLDKSDWRE